MATSFLSNSAKWSGSALLAIALQGTVATGAPEDVWKELQEQNRVLRAQLQTQQHQLDELRAQMDRLAGVEQSPSSTDSTDNSSYSRDSSGRKLVVSAEVGIAFFAASKNGQYSNQEFRVDDADLRVEASLGHSFYLFGEVQVAKREWLAENFQLGEFYLEYENLSGALGGPDRLINLRFGRIDIPFGEEYQHRGPLNNPLITHSLSDVWGIDEGIELYGEWARATYVFAVQNGSSKMMRDFNADKTLTARLGYKVTSRLQVSASAMRTGELDSAREPLSEVWLGNNTFRNIGSAVSTTHQAELAQVDAAYRWSNGHVTAAAGRARYRDNDRLNDNTRRFTYYQAEFMQSLTRELYGAARVSTLEVDDGYPLTGIGNLNKYFLGNLRTKELRRVTVGGGYRFNRSLVLKLDYTLENAELISGLERDTRMFSFESAVGF